MRKLLILILLFFIVISAVMLLRGPVLRGAATLLMHVDTLQKADAMFVLSGGGYDRGNQAVKLFKQGYTDKIICTGGNPFIEIRVFGIDTLESDMTVANLKRQGVVDSNIGLIHYGTSTREEADTIISYCKQQGFKKVIVLSSLLHTARVNKVLRHKFEEAHVKVIIQGAPSSRFNEMLWWQNEDGLIAVNNEWIKTAYYWVKY
jgi:uncharacterized SAM-binding protein YcdF (DUF218 family)